MLDGGQHQVAHVVAGDAACGGEEAHGFPITAIERKRNPHPLAIVAADLEAIGAPASIALIDCDAAVMPPLDTASVGSRLSPTVSAALMWPRADVEQSQYAVVKHLRQGASNRRFSCKF
jgi:hypothetical protein